jgi:hypothetical protein
LGAVDYLAMGQLFHTVIIRDIPQLNMKKKTQARRFITLIDTFYDNKVRPDCLPKTSESIFYSSLFCQVRILFSADVPLKILFATKTTTLTDEITDEITDEQRKQWTTWA